VSSQLRKKYSLKCELSSLSSNKTIGQLFFFIRRLKFSNSSSSPQSPIQLKTKYAMQYIAFSKI